MGGGVRVKEGVVPCRNKSPPFLPRRVGALQEGERPHPQYPHPHLCGPAARGARGAGSKLPIFSLAAKLRLFILYIYVHQPRACSQPSLEDTAQESPSNPPLLCACAYCWKHLCPFGVLMGGSCVGHTTSLLGLVSSRPWPEFIHSSTRCRSVPHLTPGASQPARRTKRNHSCALETVPSKQEPSTLTYELQSGGGNRSRNTLGLQV